MRRTLLLTGVVLLLAVAFAGPAAAQARDPFSPVVTEGDTPNLPGEPGVQPLPNVNPNPDPGVEGLPNTGATQTNWWVVAYGLLAAGSTALLVAWSRRPISLR